VFVQAALDGMGLILVPDWLVQEYQSSGRLVTMLADYRIAARGVDSAIYVVHPPGPYTARKVRAFVDHLDGYFKNTLPGA
jgi:DNA-binding transcriptional LysR family regulator